MLTNFVLCIWNRIHMAILITQFFADYFLRAYWQRSSPMGICPIILSIPLRQRKGFWECVEERISTLISQSKCSRRLEVTLTRSFSCHGFHRLLSIFATE